MVLVLIMILADYDASAENDQDACAAENDYDPSADYDASEEIPV